MIDAEPYEPLDLTDFNKYTVTGASFNTMLPIGNVNIMEGWGSKTIEHTYKPQPDITTYELALLLNLFVFASTSTGFSYDYWDYVKKHNLERHFI